MAEQTPARRRAVIAVVLGIALIGVLGMLLVGLIRGDETDQIDPQNGEVVITPLLR
jgi:hypothetical protein